MTTLDASSSRKKSAARCASAKEIFTDNDGEVVFKKYSPVGEMSTFAGQYAEVLNKVTNRPVVMCDRDHVIAVAGVSKKEYLERRVSPELEEYMQNRMSYPNGDASGIRPVEGIDRTACILYPIIASSDVNGAVVLLSSETQEPAGETDEKLVQAAAFFLAKQMEE